MKQLFQFVAVTAVIGFIAAFVFVKFAEAATAVQIANGGTGTSTAPSYGQIPIGGKNGEYEYVASSTFGGGGSTGFSTTSAAYWLTQQTTSNLTEGSNLYWTQVRFDNALTATTSLPKITTLSSLSLPYTQVTGTPDLTQYFKLSDWYATTSAAQLTSLANLSTVGTITSGTWHGTALADAYIASSGNWNTAYSDRITGANYPLSITSNVLSVVATSSFGCTVSCFTSHNISQWTNDADYLTGNQSITISGAVSGSGSTAITAEFASTTPVQFGGTGSTTLTGILKGNGISGVQTAVGDTDYQKPISLTTSGSSGAATFSGDTLNIPNYSFSFTEPYWVYANSAISTSTPVLISASTTIGNGNQNGGLTINGGATTTGTAYFTGTGVNSGFGLAQLVLKGGNMEEGLSLQNSGTGGRNYGIISTGNGSGVGNGVFDFTDETSGTSLLDFNSSHTLFLPQLTSNGFLKTSGGTGQVSVDTTSYTPTTRNVNTTYPLQGGGSLASDLTLTFGGLSTTSPWTNGQLAEVTSGNQVTSVATSTLTPSAPLGGSFTQVGSGGTLTCTTCLTGNQTITFSGDVTGSGATAITTAFNLANPHWWTATQNFTNASTSQFTATSTVWLTSLGTPAGTFLAVDPNGKVIATTTPSGGGGVTSISGTTNQISASASTGAVTLSLPNLVVFPSSASSTKFSNLNTAYFGSTATTTIDSAGNIVIPSGSTLTSGGNVTINSPGTALYVANRAANTNYAGLQLTTAGTGNVDWTIGTRGDGTSNLDFYADSGSHLVGSVTSTGGNWSLLGSLQIAANEVLSQLGNDYLQFQNNSATDQYSNFEIEAPAANPDEADLVEDTPLPAGADRFTDWDNENYSGESLTNITEGISNGGTFNPFAIRFCNLNSGGACSAHSTYAMIAMPSGTDAFGVQGTSSVDQTAGVQIASSTASNILEVDTSPGTHIFTVKSGGASTTKLSAFGPSYFGATATSSFSTAGALTLVNAANALVIPNLGTAAGAFLAVDPSGNVIATTTPTGGTGCSSPCTIAQGGTATTTGGNTNGVEYYSGTTLTNSSNFLSNGSQVSIGKAINATIALDIKDGSSQGLRLEGSTAAILGFSTFVTGDSQVRYSVFSDGTEKWGSGAATADTGLSRSSAGILAFGTGAAGSTAGGFIATNASTTLLSNVGTAYFGGTATSTFSSTGALTLVNAANALTIPALGTSAGAFLAVDPSGHVISTTTPSGTGAVSSVSNSDGTLSISPTTGAVVASLALAHANSWTGLQTFANATSTLLTSTTAWVTTESVQTLEGTEYADQFAGSDIGAQINAAYAACPSTGCTIVVPAGSYSFSTEIQITTANKVALIQCSPGNATTLTYTGSATSTIFNASQSHRYAWGVTGCSFTGPGTSGSEGTTAGIEIGGTNGAEGLTLEGVRIQHFGIDFYVGNNTWVTNVDQSGFSAANKVFAYGGTTNSGERLNFTNSVFFSNDSNLFNSPSDHCFDLGNGVASADLTNDSFDYCQIYVGTNDLSVDINGGHIENPWGGSGTGQGTSPFIYIATSTQSTVKLSNLTMMNDATTTGNNPAEFINDYGTLLTDNVTLDENGTQTIANFIKQTGSASFTVSDLYTKGSGSAAVTNIYNGVGPVATVGNGIIDYLASKSSSWGQGFYASGNNDFTFTDGGNAGAFFDANNLWWFPDGIDSEASSTIGSGTQIGGLTVSGGATTTANAYFATNVGIGTSTFGTIFSINNSANFVSGGISSIYNGLQAFVHLIIPNSSNPKPTTTGDLQLSTNAPYQLQVGNGSGTTVFDPRPAFILTVSSTTALTGTTTSPVFSFPATVAVTSWQCTAQPGGATAEVEWQYANPTAYTSVTPTYLAASTTPGVVSITSNNTPSAQATSTLSVGNVTGSPTSVSCTFLATTTPI